RSGAATGWAPRPDGERPVDTAGRFFVVSPMPEERVELSRGCPRGILSHPQLQLSTGQRVGSTIFLAAPGEKRFGYTTYARVRFFSLGSTSTRTGASGVAPPGVTSFSSTAVISRSPTASK